MSSQLSPEIQLCLTSCIGEATLVTIKKDPTRSKDNKLVYYLVFKDAGKGVKHMIYYDHSERKVIKASTISRMFQEKCKVSNSEFARLNEELYEIVSKRAFADLIGAKVD